MVQKRMNQQAELRGECCVGLKVDLNVDLCRAGSRDEAKQQLQEPKAMAEFSKLAMYIHVLIISCLQ